jgi:hypothetical protein
VPRINSFTPDALVVPWHPPNHSTRPPGVIIAPASSPALPGRGLCPRTNSFSLRLARHCTRPTPELAIAPARPEVIRPLASEGKGCPADSFAPDELILP